MSLQVLKDAGSEGMSLGEIMDVSQSRGLKDWEPGAKRILQFVSTPVHQLTATVHDSSKEKSMPSGITARVSALECSRGCIAQHECPIGDATAHRASLQHGSIPADSG